MHVLNCKTVSAYGMQTDVINTDIDIVKLHA